MNKFIQLKRSFRAFDKVDYCFKLFNLLNGKSTQGITLVDLLVAMLIAGVIGNLSYLVFSWNRQLYLNDVARNDASQTFKTVFDIVGSQIKQVGEGLDANFPAILIKPYPVNPPSPNPPNLNSPTFNSEITIRRLINSAKLPICRNVTAGTKTNAEIFIVDTTVAGCNLTDNDNDGWPDNLAQWKNYRTTNGGTVRAFIYDGVSQAEPLSYASESFYNSSNSSITPIANPTTLATRVSAAALRVSGTLASAYTAGSSAQLLLIEERKYRLGCNDSSFTDASCPSDKLQNLQLIVNDGTLITVANNISQFALTTTLRQDITSTTTAKFICWVIPAIGSTQTGTSTCNNDPPTTTQAIKLTNLYAWSQIYSVNVTVKPQPISATDSSLSTNTKTTINNLQETQKFLPRNVLNY